MIADLQGAAALGSTPAGISHVYPVYQRELLHMVPMLHAMANKTPLKSRYGRSEFLGKKLVKLVSKSGM